MSSDRVTVSLPTEFRESAQHIAEESGVSFSSVVAEALAVWLRGRLVDGWSLEYQSEHGAFDEDEVKAVAEELDLPYLPPGREAESPR
jgi:hypothetical protein